MHRRLRNWTDTFRRFGAVAALRVALHRVVNLVLPYDSYYIFVLERDQIRPFTSPHLHRFQIRTATREDLLGLVDRPECQIDAVKIAAFDAGDTCLLNLVDGQVVGYSWIHDAGRAEVMPGFDLAVPRAYVYNYATLTLPAARGLGLQGYRDQAILAEPKWADRRGLLGYIRTTNFPSISGARKSGCWVAGRMLLFGRPPWLYVWFSPALRRLGVARLPCIARSDRIPRQTPPDESGKAPA